MYRFSTCTSQSTEEISRLFVGSSSMRSCGTGSARSTCATAARKRSPPESSPVLWCTLATEEQARQLIAQVLFAHPGVCPLHALQESQLWIQANALRNISPFDAIADVVGGLHGERYSGSLAWAMASRRVVLPLPFAPVMRRCSGPLRIRCSGRSAGVPCWFLSPASAGEKCR